MSFPALNLYFDDGLIAAASKAMEREPVASALAFLNAQPGDVIRQKPAPTRQDKTATEPVLRRPTTPHEEMLIQAYRWRFLDDANAGAAATAALFESGYGLTSTETAAEGLRQWTSAVQIADLLHAEPHFAHQAAAWYQAAHERLTALHQAAGEYLIDQAWLQLADLIWALRVDDSAARAAALDHLRRIVDEIHPEGYVKSVLTAKESERNFQQMLELAGVLCLAAEAAERANGGLWGYQNRGVGISTAVAYVVSFYFYPQKWRWEGPLEQAFITAEFVQHGAFLEIAARRAPLRATDIVLDDLRPMFSLCFGGLTTLTHGAPAEPEPKRRRFLW
ncbi:hypothetical protein VZO05_01505 [Aggregatilineales bacterium SYSU G02658]